MNLRSNNNVGQGIIGLNFIKMWKDGFYILCGSSWVPGGVIMLVPKSDEGIILDFQVAD